MLETSKDILNISLAVSVFGLAFLIGWMLVYFLLIIRRVVKILQGVEQAMNKIGDFVDLAREKLDHSASYLSILATGARDLVNYLITKRQAKSSRKK
ncbi:MAG: hypothetical protein UV57_C0043G0003 [Parcubacteria group bacterium GW2011_GWD2_43_10]|uniref:Uncharacterized protein n=5 Tax=Candidatus Vebleniibacteriota TaxID=1817921 RepID=A0A1G2Q7Y8_9BACT|nr:MAG: hypothetical protein UV47_C0016G0004 [Parcubacteria group bacterium GW2011_GWA2_42_80]KKS78544.1 MAG: hypothetical protein UV52_C0036G0008 [Parcubacteria group bacterium GW2011_GWD1_42_9]KKS81589.1 MAG: hypothetical protein UV57_C0043G0003 [Parcubacteria group bacterium GW2011_GWD2_43_10]KKS93209.1 MAG: hypothetical protein UV69_C0011G0011 [Parcubacteria group bacterium GW2011_GWE2_43_12]KKT14072.1 MAG: hypothetical protein UV92_C0007G0010 [Parcubacteria group bacterium GW2011_GWA1_43_2